MSNIPARSSSPDTLPSSGARTPSSPPNKNDLLFDDDGLGTTITTAAAAAEEAAAAAAAGSYEYISSMWTGLIRRFSSEDAGHFPTQHSVGGGVGGGGHPHQHLEHARSFGGYTDGVNGVFNPAKRTVSPFRPPPLDPLVLHGFKDSTPDKARLLSHAVAEEIRTMVPERLRITEDWRLVYSLEQDGASLATLYQNCRQFQGRRVGFVLVVKDQEGAVFGAYLSEYPRPAPTYFGNGECFLWRASTLTSLPPPPSADTTNMTRNTTLAPGTPHHSSSSSSGAGPCPSPTPSESIRFKAFPYSGLNDCYINCEQGFLSVGSGGGHYGLWVDSALEVGHSSRCETFGNEPLSDEGEKFGVLGVEFWVIGS